MLLKYLYVWLCCCISIIFECYSVRIVIKVVRMRIGNEIDYIIDMILFILDRWVKIIECIEVFFFNDMVYFFVVVFMFNNVVVDES